MQMRDLVQLTGPIRRAAKGNVFAAALAQRLGDVRAGRRDTIWTALWALAVPPSRCHRRLLDLQAGRPEPSSWRGSPVSSSLRTS